MKTEGEQREGWQKEKEMSFGFSIEMFVWLAITLVVIGLMASLVVPPLRKYFQKRAEAERRARMPRLYRCENNGVIAVVRADDHEMARQTPGQGSLLIVQNTMVFCADGHLYPVNINDRRTSNLEDYRRLTTGCIVEDRWNIFVPFSSFVWGKEWQYQRFPRITMSAAMNLVHGHQAVVERSS